MNQYQYQQQQQQQFNQEPRMFGRRRNFGKSQSNHQEINDTHDHCSHPRRHHHQGHWRSSVANQFNDLPTSFNIDEHHCQHHRFQGCNHSNIESFGFNSIERGSHRFRRFCGLENTNNNNFNDFVDPRPRRSRRSSHDRESTNPTSTNDQENQSSEHGCQGRRRRSRHQQNDLQNNSLNETNTANNDDTCFKCERIEQKIQKHQSRFHSSGESTTDCHRCKRISMRKERHLQKSHQAPAQTNDLKSTNIDIDCDNQSSDNKNQVSTNETTTNIVGDNQDSKENIKNDNTDTESNKTNKKCHKHQRFGIRGRQFQHSRCQNRLNSGLRRGNKFIGEDNNHHSNSTTKENRNGFLIRKLRTQNMRLRRIVSFNNQRTFRNHGHGHQYDQYHQTPIIGRRMMNRFIQRRQFNNFTFDPRFTQPMQFTPLMRNRIMNNRFTQRPDFNGFSFAPRFTRPARSSMSGPMPSNTHGHHNFRRFNRFNGHQQQDNVNHYNNMMMKTFQRPYFGNPSYYPAYFC
ncbi:hypothetical protein PPL_02183 [Heterostelium album PN500]|uniref:Uncharacterized protein n=1 Tax=Heterostelium pallidum (strain ATCC 26659 / Pp 5 / PN500) TaxID=670386 RepID=D3B1K9_HETP5|nr:hypothetical protein PPL_02183 [Heterostelium album PN500]EFA85183.1 hypothetical protein PPL_02183 [Heterostelium album PN500]|eukprot:XP_020437292.1 hypothetical protein PPL_02183 [Heterostelium album PN500]